MSPTTAPFKETVFRKTISGRIRDALHTVGVDRPVALVAGGRAWALLAGPISLYLIATRLSPEAQGYYYTFSNVLALSSFLELGLAYVLSTFASHEAAHLTWSPEGTLIGDPSAKARLSYLLRVALKWYSGAAALMALVLLIVGTLFFSQGDGGQSLVQWRGPWVLVAIATSIACLLLPVWAVLEGCGRVAEVGFVRLVQQAGGNSLLWVALLLDWQLYAAPIVTTFGLLWGLAWLAQGRGRVILDLLGTNGASDLSWNRDVWPLQWRVAVTWISSWFIYQLFNPILFHFQGPAAAGQMGMSLTLAGALSPLSAAWITTKTPRMAGLVATRRFRELDDLFFRAFWQSLGFLTLSGLVIVGGVFALNGLGHPLAQRILPPIPFCALVLAITANHVVMAESLYLRAHKQEVLMRISIALGASMAVGGYLAGRYIGAAGLAYTYFGLSLVIGVGGGSYLFRTKRKELHTPSQDSLKPAGNSTFL